MNVEVIDVDGDQLIVRDLQHDTLIDVFSQHDTQVGDILSGAFERSGIDTLRNVTRNAVLVAFCNLSDPQSLERTVF